MKKDLVLAKYFLFRKEKANRHSHNNIVCLIIPSDKYSSVRMGILIPFFNNATCVL